MYGIYLEWKAKSLLEWVRLAQEAEKEEKWSDAHYCWMKGSTAHTGNKRKIKEMQLNALKVFEKWQKNI